MIRRFLADREQRRFTLINNAQQVVGLARGANVLIDGGGHLGMFGITNAVVYEFFDPDGAFSTTPGATTSTNVFLSTGGALVVENRHGATTSYSLYAAGVL